MLENYDTADSRVFHVRGIFQSFLNGAITSDRNSTMTSARLDSFGCEGKYRDSLKTGRAGLATASCCVGVPVSSLSGVAKWHKPSVVAWRILWGAKGHEVA